MLEVTAMKLQILQTTVLFGNTFSNFKYEMYEMQFQEWKVKYWVSAGLA